MTSEDIWPIVIILIISFHSCMAYQNYTVENGKLCSPIKKNTIKIGGRSDGYAVIVRETRQFHHWQGYISFMCRFEIKGKNKIIAVIQKLNFRHNESGYCVDYVQFKSENEVSEEICGSVNARNPELLPVDSDGSSNIYAPSAFVTQENRNLDVVIYVANKKLNHNEKLELEIVFTSAQDCSLAPRKYLNCGNNLCIRDEFFEDDFVNCPFVNCPDENGCSSGPRKTGVGSRVTVGAITAVLLSFLLFFGCIWLSRRYNRMCWSAEFGNRRLRRMIHVPPTAHQRENSEIADEGSAQEVARTAPHTATISPPSLGSTIPTSPSLPDKDLPPPYETLFPDR